MIINHKCSNGFPAHWTVWVLLDPIFKALDMEDVLVAALKLGNQLVTVQLEVFHADSAIFNFLLGVHIRVLSRSFPQSLQDGILIVLLLSLFSSVLHIENQNDDQEEEDCPGYNFKEEEAHVNCL